MCEGKWKGLGNNSSVPLNVGEMMNNDMCVQYNRQKEKHRAQYSVYSCAARIARRETRRDTPHVVFEGK